MTTLHDPATETAINDAYLRGRQDQLDICVRHNLVRVADILDVIDRHAGNGEALRAGILTALGHDGGAR